MRSIFSFGTSSKKKKKRKDKNELEMIKPEWPASTRQTKQATLHTNVWTKKCEILSAVFRGTDLERNSPVSSLLFVRLNGAVRAVWLAVTRPDHLCADGSALFCSLRKPWQTEVSQHRQRRLLHIKPLCLSPSLSSTLPNLSHRSLSTHRREMIDFLLWKTKSRWTRGDTRHRVS